MQHPLVAFLGIPLLAFAWHFQVGAFVFALLTIICAAYVVYLSIKGVSNTVVLICSSLSSHRDDVLQTYPHSYQAHICFDDL